MRLRLACEPPWLHDAGVATRDVICTFVWLMPPEARARWSTVGSGGVHPQTKRHDAPVCLDRRSSFFRGSSALYLCRHDGRSHSTVEVQGGCSGRQAESKARELEEVRSPDLYGIPGRRTPKRTCHGDIMAPLLLGASYMWVWAGGKYGFIFGGRVAERTATATAQVAAVLPVGY